MLALAVVGVLLLRLAGIRKGRVIEKVNAVKQKRKETKQHKKLIALEIKAGLEDLDEFIENTEDRHRTRKAAAEALAEELAKRPDSKSGRLIMDRVKARLRRVRDSGTNGS